MEHCTVVFFSWGLSLRGKDPWKHNKNPLTKKSLKIRIHYRTNENIDYLRVLED